MVPTTPRRRAALGLLAVAALALPLAACGGKSDSGASNTPTTSADDALAGKVPAAIKSDGKIMVGSDTTYAPNEFLDADGKTAVGFDVDLFKAVAGKLGLQAEFETATFANIIPGVASDKYEVGVSSFTINAERLAETNMVSYFSAGTQWATKKGNPAGIKADDACGKKIAVQKDTVQHTDDLPARNAKCKATGKPEITIDPYQAQDAATAAVVSGKDDAMLADSPICAYAVKQTNGELALLGEIYDSAPYGYVVKKDQTAFAELLRDALKALIADGSYQKILDKWGVQAGAITAPEVNPKLDGAAPTPSASS